MIGGEAAVPGTSTSGHLRRTLGPISLWGLGVGYVISGEYFGWNLGLPLGGTYGMLVATLAISVLYLCFVVSYAELACAIPRAGGAFVYCSRALGPFWGCLAGLVQIIEFVFAPPAIAMAIGAYLGQRFTGTDPRVMAIASYFIFTGLTAWAGRQAAMFELVSPSSPSASCSSSWGSPLPRSSCPTSPGMRSRTAGRGSSPACPSPSGFIWR